MAARLESTAYVGSKDQITIYAGVGLAFQDTMVAWQIYRAATDRAMAKEIEFLAWAFEEVRVTAMISAPLGLSPGAV